MDENSNQEIQKFSNEIESNITKIPSQTRGNFFKAFKQLCSASVTSSTTWLQERTTELKEASEARVKVLKNQTQLDKDQSEVPQEFATKASMNYASKILREQENLDEITLHAAKELASDMHIEKGEEESKSANPTEEIEDDWLNEFENHARLKSSEDMRLIFGKILSGEILKPGSFSIRTVRLISQLDSKAAKLFQTLCSNSISLRFGSMVLDARVVSINGNAASNSLRQLGLSFDNLNVLQEYGLVISDYNSYMGYSACIANENNQVSGTIYFNNTHYGLKPIQGEKYDKELKLHGVALTKAGKELLDIIPIQTNENYQKALFEYFEKKHFQIVEVEFQNETEQ